MRPIGRNQISVQSSGFSKPQPLTPVEDPAKGGETLSSMHQIG